MPAGRKPNPDNLAILRATDRKDRKRAKPPVKPGRPDAPDDLTDCGRHWFGIFCDRLEEQGRLSEAFAEVLTIAASRRAQIEEAERVLAAEGTHYESPTQGGGMIRRAHPMLAQLNEAQRHLQSLLAELGLTPASLHKVALGSGGAERNPFEVLEGGGSA